MVSQSSLVHIRIHNRILAKMDEEIAEQNKRMKVPFNRSTFIRWAIVMQLEVSRQRRKVGKKSNKFLCTGCRKRKSTSELSYKTDNLFGEVELICNACAGKSSSE